MDKTIYFQHISQIMWCICKLGPVTSLSVGDNHNRLSLIRCINESDLLVAGNPLNLLAYESTGATRLFTSMSVFMFLLNSYRLPIHLDYK